MSQMRVEALEIPQRVAALLQTGSQALAGLGRRWRAEPPSMLLTAARGSSDHAAGFLAFMAMTRLGTPAGSVPLSVFSVHGARWCTPQAWLVALSQSGRSPDLLAATQAMRDGGAYSVALVNDVGAPLSQVVDCALPLQAGVEQSVAATKSFMAQLVAATLLVAACADDKALWGAFDALPAQLQLAQQRDWQPAVDVLRGASGLYVLGRGAGLAVAQELALKLKEVCGLQAEAFSTAEVQHGPMSLVHGGFPLLVLAPRGPAQTGIIEVARHMQARGATVLLAAPPDVEGGMLPLQTAHHPELDPLLLVQSAYLMIESLSRARGLDPDRPRHLRKVTYTV